MVKMTGGYALVQALANENIRVIFGLPGVQILDIYNSLYQHPEIKVVTVRHEQATSQMANGYAKATGEPGVAIVVPGPGLLNAATGVGIAYSTSTPILLVSGQIPSSSLGKKRGELHEIEDQMSVLKTMTKWQAMALKASDIPSMVREAFRQMKTGRPRPVEIEVPLDVLASSDEVDFPRPEPGEPLAADQESISMAVDILSRAERPVVLAGGGTIISEAHQELWALAEFLQTPVLTTPEGKGSIPEDHHLALGCSSLGYGAASTILPKADVILAVGTRLHRPQGLMKGQKLIHVDVDESVIGREWPTTLGIKADAKLALAQMLAGLRARIPPREPKKSEAEELKEKVKEEIRAAAPLQTSIIEDIRSVLDRDAIVVSGMTNIGYWANLAFPVYEPRTYITCGYFGALGYAFPTALGAKVGRPERQVVALCGDGGFLYGCSELATAVQNNLSVVTIVFNDSCYGAVKMHQRIEYRQRFVGVELANPDFVKLAEAFVAKGIRVEAPSGLKDALKDALRYKEPVVVEMPMPTLEAPFHIPRSVSARE
jgi:acetolactate synthase-1/2/3 large subunit